MRGDCLRIAATRLSENVAKPATVHAGLRSAHDNERAFAQIVRQKFFGFQARPRFDLGRVDRLQTKTFVESDVVNRYRKYLPIGR